MISVDTINRARPKKSHATAVKMILRCLKQIAEKGVIIKMLLAMKFFVIIRLVN